MVEHTVTATCDSLSEQNLQQLEDADITIADHSSPTDNPGGASRLTYTFTVDAKDADAATAAVEQALAGAHAEDVSAA